MLPPLILYVCAGRSLQRCCMFSLIRDHFSARHLGLFGLCVMAFVYLALFRYDLYGIEEAAARALLINWSIIHQIASPVALFGVPDLRGFLFVLLDLHWAGSLIAAKVFTMLVLFGTLLGLYRWAERHIGDEAAMIVTGLLILLPVSIMQTDAVGGGIYVFSGLLIIAWLDETVKASPFDVPGLMFLEAALLALVISIHPAGLAAAVVLLLNWWRMPDASKAKRRNVMIAMAVGVIIPLVLRLGWPDAAGFSGDFMSYLSSMVLGPELLPFSDQFRQGAGLILAVLLVLVLLVALWQRQLDTLGWFLLLGCLLGSWHVNDVWLFLAAVTLLYLGIPMLLQLNARLGFRGLMGQRGLVLLTVFLVATMAMTTDRHYRSIGQQHLMNLQDQLIDMMAADASLTGKDFMAASEWPARTLLACKRDVLPLPVVHEGDDDPQRLLQRIKGVTHVLFDPREEKNHQLAQQFSALNPWYETVALNSAGVVLRVRQGETSSE